MMRVFPQSIDSIDQIRYSWISKIEERTALLREFHTGDRKTHTIAGIDTGFNCEIRIYGGLEAENTSMGVIAASEEHQSRGVNKG